MRLSRLVHGYQLPPPRPDRLDGPAKPDPKPVKKPKKGKGK